MKKNWMLVTVLAIFVLSSLATADVAKSTIKVNGMTCMGCVQKIEKAVSKVDGVKSVDVDLKSGEAVVEYDANKTDVSKLEAAIAAVGYDAGSTKTSDPHKCRKKEGVKDCQKGDKGCCSHKSKAKPCCKKGTE